MVYFTCNTKNRKGVTEMKKLFYFILSTIMLSIFLTACQSDDSDGYYDNQEIDDIYDTSTDNTSTDDFSSPYSEEELKADPTAPSTNPEDYNSDGEYVPASGPSTNPADYNAAGEYKPVDKMSQEEIQAELEEMLGQ
jgi:hypothetical protein